MRPCAEDGRRALAQTGLVAQVVLPPDAPRHFELGVELLDLPRIINPPPGGQRRFLEGRRLVLDGEGADRVEGELPAAKVLDDIVDQLLRLGRREVKDERLTDNHGQAVRGDVAEPPFLHDGQAPQTVLGLGAGGWWRYDAPAQVTNDGQVDVVPAHVAIRPAHAQVPAVEAAAQVDDLDGLVAVVV